MEALTELRFVGTERVEAWCPICMKWIHEVEIVHDCRDIIYCPDCKTALIRSEKNIEYGES